MATRNEYAAIAAEGGTQALTLVAALMDQSANEREQLERSLLESTEQDRDRWKERAIEAERRLYRIQDRLLSLLD